MGEGGGIAAAHGAGGRKGHTSCTHMAMAAPRTSSGHAALQHPALAGWLAAVYVRLSPLFPSVPGHGLTRAPPAPSRACACGVHRESPGCQQTMPPCPDVHAWQRNRASSPPCLHRPTWGAKRKPRVPKTMPPMTKPVMKPSLLRLSALQAPMEKGDHGGGGEGRRERVLWLLPSALQCAGCGRASAPGWGRCAWKGGRGRYACMPRMP